MEPAEVRLPYMGRESWALAVVGCGVREGLGEKAKIFTWNLLWAKGLGKMSLIDNKK